MPQAKHNMQYMGNVHTHECVPRGTAKDIVFSPTMWMFKDANQALHCSPHHPLPTHNTHKHARHRRDITREWHPCQCPLHLQPQSAILCDDALHA